MVGFWAVACGVSCEKAMKAMRGNGSGPGAASGLEEAEALAKFRGDARLLYDNREFPKLEALAKRLRDGRERAADGEWRLLDFYESQDCRDDEPEGVWQLHDQIHKEWEKQFPQSITARVSRARFLIEYAWHARGSGQSETVTRDGTKLFNERLAEARTVLTQAKTLQPACPVWYTSMMKVALGQNWSRQEYEALFREAKSLEKEFHYYDCSRAHFLLPRWYGKPGDWEKAAELEIETQGATGHAVYARVVMDSSLYYRNVFQESAASWPKTKRGFEDLVKSHPESGKMLNTYCRMACLAGDKAQAKVLFDRIGMYEVQEAWKPGEFAQARKWVEKK